MAPGRRRKTPRRSTSRKRQPTPHPVEAYALAVTAGEIIAGPHVRAACARHLQDLRDGSKRGLRWDPVEAKRKIGLFGKALRLSGGEYEGRPFRLLPWEAFIIGSVFGWKRANGLRRFRVVYIEAGKGCGKTPLAAGIGLIMLCMDDEPRAEVYAAATMHDQARVLFRDAIAMVEQSPALTEALDCTGGAEKDNIAYIKTGSFFRPISSERRGRGKSGPRPHCAILDEIHEHPTNAMVEFLSAGVKHRRQPLIVMITNSGSDRETVCWDYHQFAVQVADGTKENDEFFSYVCALDEGDEPFKDESCWIKANPSLPGIPGYDYIRSQVRAAIGMPSKENLVRRLNLCEWTESEDAWITAEVWQSIEAALDLSAYEGKPCWGGLDLSLSNALTALVLLFEGEPRHWDAFSWFWMPGDLLPELEEKEGHPYGVWRDQGHLLAPPGKIISYAHVGATLAELSARFVIQGIGYDRAKLEYLQVELEKIGCSMPLVAHGQGFFKAADTGLWMPKSIEELEAAIKEQRLRVHVNPVLRLNVAGAVTVSSQIEPADRYFSKKRAEGRIDGVVALAMAMGAATRDAGTSIYESRGPLFAG